MTVGPLQPNNTNLKQNPRSSDASGESVRRDKNWGLGAMGDGKKRETICNPVALFSIIWKDRGPRASRPETARTGTSFLFFFRPS
jgi:hypothetical protein